MSSKGCNRKLTQLACNGDGSLPQAVSSTKNSPSQHHSQQSRDYIQSNYFKLNTFKVTLYCTHTCSRTEMENTAIMVKQKLFINQMNLELKESIMKCLIWSVALYGLQMWTSSKDMCRTEALQMRIMEPISSVNKVTNEEALTTVNEGRLILKVIQQHQHSLIETWQPTTSDYCRTNEGQAYMRKKTP